MPNYWRDKMKYRIPEFHSVDGGCLRLRAAVSQQDPTWWALPVLDTHGQSVACLCHTGKPELSVVCTLYLGMYSMIISSRVHPLSRNP